MKGQQSNGESRDIEEVFMNSFWEEVNKFHIEDDVDEESVSVERSRQDTDSVMGTPSLSLDFSQSDTREERSLLSSDLMGEMDALLSMAFEQYATDTTQTVDPVAEIEEESINCHRLYEK